MNPGQPLGLDWNQPPKQELPVGVQFGPYPSQTGQGQPQTGNGNIPAKNPGDEGQSQTGHPRCQAQEKTVGLSTPGAFQAAADKP